MERAVPAHHDIQSTYVPLGEVHYADNHNNDGGIDSLHASDDARDAYASSDYLEENDEDFREVTDSGLDFVEGDNFQSFIGVVIFMNTLVLWGQTDYPDCVLWTVADNTFLLIFIIEVTIRLLYVRPKDYLHGPTRFLNYLDVTIVVCTIVDLWLIPLLVRLAGLSHEPQRIIRFLRLMRLFRLLRLFHMFSELRKFAAALMGMGMKFIWIFTVLTLLIFSTAIVLTHLLGHGEALGRRDELEADWAIEFDDINAHFGDVGTSAFTLFQITTADDWATVGSAVLKIDPRWRIFFYLFIMFASWTMISVLTAVASNSMFEATSIEKAAEKINEERMRMRFVTFLRDSFIAADVDGNGLLDKEEFDALLEKPFVHEQMRNLGINIRKAELADAWKTMDYNFSGELTIDEFVDGLSFLQEGLGTKHIVNVDYSLKRVHARVEVRMEKAKFDLDELVKETQEVVDQLKAQGDTQHQQQRSFWLWQQWAQRSVAFKAEKNTRGRSESEV